MCNEEKGPESDSVVSWLLIFKNYRIRQQIDDLSLSLYLSLSLSLYIYIYIFLIIEYLVHSFECWLIFWKFVKLVIKGSTKQYSENIFFVTNFGGLLYAEN